MFSFEVYTAYSYCTDTNLDNNHADYGSINHAAADMPYVITVADTICD